MFWGPRPPQKGRAAAAMLRGSLFARPFAGFASSVWPLATRSAALGPQRPCGPSQKRYSSLRSSFVFTTPPTRPSSGFPKESLRGAVGGFFREKSPYRLALQPQIGQKPELRALLQLTNGPGESPELICNCKTALYSCSELICNCKTALGNPRS